jgi:hypothetical protein
MIFQIGLENGAEGRSQAWVLGHPGCFAYGPDANLALASTPQAIREYAAWIVSHCGEEWLPLDDLEIRLDESYQVFNIDPGFNLAEQGYEVNAWFRDDWKPLQPEEIERGLRVLSWSRVDLYETVNGLSSDVMRSLHPGERWSIMGVLRHIAGAEWWYLDRLGLAFPREHLREEPYERLAHVRDRLMEILPALSGSSQVIGVDGEIWSPRKLLRRAAWHERDHIQHIRKLIELSRAAVE